MSLSRNWDLRIDPSVFKFLKRIPSHDAEAIIQIIKALPTNPYFGDIQKMKDEENVWRRRIGSYRFFYKIKNTENVILVFHLERRTSKTY